MECMEKDYTHITYGTEDLVNNGDGIPSKVNPDMMLNKKGLGAE